MITVQLFQEGGETGVKAMPTLVTKIQQDVEIPEDTGQSFQYTTELKIHKTPNDDTIDNHRR